MRKLLISTALIGLFALPALAQPDHDHDHGPGGAPQGQQGGPPGGGHDHGGGGPQGQQGGPPGGGRDHGGGGAPHQDANPSFSRGGPNGNGRPTTTGNPVYSRGGPSGNAANQSAPNPAYSRGGSGDHFNPGGPNRPAPSGQGFNRGGPNGGPGGQGGGHHDFHGFVDFHQNFTAPRHFHAGDYHRPQGWYAHRWVFGEFLPPLFWAQDYWLADYMDYALPPPPPYAVWVRYGDDALLIDRDSGEIITVEYGVFY